MSPDNPFLQALLAEPDDDTLRLAMADWLDENDQPGRAEFVRVQVELARGVEDRDHRRHLEFRQRDLLLAHEAGWVRPLAEVLGCRPGQWGGWVFRRGFAEYFHLPGKLIACRGPLLSRLTPVRELFLRPCDPINITQLCKQPWIRNLRALYLQGGRLSTGAVRGLTECPYLDRLRVLDATFAEDVPEWARTAFETRFASILRVR